ncbi:MAG: CZB domain-containing protein [Cocleimonas sp.]|nr:CZB domain-containing protein [Cocleimonas sp.]
MDSTTFFLTHLNEHIQYLTKIKATLKDKNDFCGTDHHLCKLGNWLYGDGRDQVTAISDEMATLFNKLFEPHKAFHRESVNAITAHKEGNHKERELAFTQMHVLSNTLVFLLLKMDATAR